MHPSIYSVEKSVLIICIAKKKKKVNRKRQIPDTMYGLFCCYFMQMKQTTLIANQINGKI